MNRQPVSGTVQIMNFRRLFQPKSLIAAAFIAGTPIAVGTLATLTGLAATPAVAIDVIGFQQKWLVSVDEARALMASGALVLDARNADLRTASPVRNAQPIRWRDLSSADGSLSTDYAALSLRLQSLGLSADQPVVVLADPFQALGEDARVVWALRTLGHGQTVMVDGGLPALLASGLPTIQPPLGAGNFVVERHDDWSLLPAEAAHGLVLLKAASAPDLLTEDGHRKPGAVIQAWLDGQGIDRDTDLATDGAEGPAAHWLAAVLIDLGYPVRNLEGAEAYLLSAAN
ncbi:MAG: hypothetical protein IPK59_14335 [Rhodospirillaceae bacterium]|nr:hypothetical protein [Rhodospirillaceae bacterium]